MGWAGSSDLDGYRGLPNATTIDKAQASRASVSDGGVAPAHSIDALHPWPACFAHRHDYVVQLLDGRDRHGLCG